jgi:hypothetical protein
MAISTLNFGSGGNLLFEACRAAALNPAEIQTMDT